MPGSKRSRAEAGIKESLPRSTLRGVTTMTAEKGSGSIKEKIYLWAKKRVGYLLTLPAIVSVGIMAVGLFY